MAGGTSLLPFPLSPSTHLFFLLLLLLLPPSLVLAAPAGDTAPPAEWRVLSLHELRWEDKDMAPKNTCLLPQKSRTQNGATILELRHHDYCRRRSQSSEEKNNNLLMLLSDNARVRSLQSRTQTQDGTADAAARFPLISGVKLQTLNYVVTIGLGEKKMAVIVDTGSDLTWVQCKPCVSCYTQKDPLFDPSTSSSYTPIPCNSAACGSLQLPAGAAMATCSANQTSTCKYSLSYGDGSYTRGELAHERINLAGTNIDGFVFGCGRSNRGLFGGASGLMGLGRSQISLISQTFPQFGGVFSYCLPSRNFDSSGSLVLGGDPSAYKNSTPIAFTPVISDPQLNPFYLLNLTGMSIGGANLQASGFATGRILIDSGTVITRLVPSIYRALKAEFLTQFSGYPPAPGFSILDTCFNLSGYQEVNVPTLKLQFDGGAEATVDVSGMFYFVKRDASQVCLALASLPYEDEMGIVGNYQQKNLRVVYDTVGSRLGFAEETCAYS